MTDLEKKILDAMIDYGAAAEGWKCKVVGITGESFSDYRTVCLELAKKRCRKPCVRWELKVDMARGNIYFADSDFCYL